jgi:hypothetical protein
LSTLPSTLVLVTRRNPPPYAEQQLQGEGWTRLEAIEESRSAMERTDQQPHQHSPGAHTAPLPPAVAAAVAQYEAATLRYDNLAAKPVPLSAADLEAFLTTQGAIFEAVVVLADHRRLDLIGASA